MQHAVEPVFREAVAADVPVIVALLADDILGRDREDLTPPLADSYFAAFAAIAADPDDCIVIAEVGGEVVACAQLTILNGLGQRGARRAQIEGVRVAAGHRGAGLGRALIEHLLARAREANCAVVQLTSDRSRTRAHEFYARLGFRPTHLGMKCDLAGRA